MREMLFHGKRIDNSEWIEGSLINDDGRCFIAIHPSLAFGPTSKDEINGETLWGFYPFFEVDPSTVGQYTGLTDCKNGKKIFEGYIVKNLINDGIFVVKYKNSLACFLGISIHGNPSTGLCSGFEVIGNIHDNPELLEVK